MSTRRPAAANVLAWAFSAGLFLVGAGVAEAETNELQLCATQYQAAKAADKLNGQAWQDFFADCKARVAAAAPEAKALAEPAEAPKTAASKPEPAAEPAAAPAKAEKTSLEELEKKCRAQWKTEETGLKKKDSKWSWRKYWKKCSAKLAGAQ